MYHAAVHDARNNTLILVVQSQRYALHGATEETVAAIAVETSVSETIRNPPLAEAQNAVGKQKKLRPRTIFNMVAVRRLEFYGTNNSKARVCTKPNTDTLDHSCSFSVRLLQSLCLVHQLHFGTLGIGSVFCTLGIIPSDFWYIWCTLVHFRSGTPVATLSVLIGIPSSFLAHWDHSWSFSARLVQSVRLVHQLQLAHWASISV